MSIEIETLLDNLLYKSKDILFDKYEDESGNKLILVEYSATKRS